MEVIMAQLAKKRNDGNDPVVEAKRLLREQGGTTLTRAQLAKNLGLTGEELSEVLGKVIQDKKYHRQGSEYFWQE